MTKPRTMLIYGDSGESKTTQLYFIAKHQIKQNGKTWRMIHLASGGYVPFEDSGMIERGEVEVYDLSNLPTKDGNISGQFSAIKKLSEGYWPIKGRLEYTDQYRTKDWSKVGGYIIEGLTDISAMWLHYTALNQIGYKANTYEEDGLSFAGADKGHYRIVQDELRRMFVHGFHLLPVPYLLVTALFDKGQDNFKTPVFGPATAGQAITDKVPSWFADVIHVESGIIKAKQPDGSIVERPGKLGWFENHIDPITGIKILARSRCAPEHYERLLLDYPGGCVPLTLRSGLDRYLIALDRIKKQMEVKPKVEAENVTAIA